jgi:hypothetical protein
VAKGNEVEGAVIDCKNITEQKIVPLPLLLIAGNAIHVKKSVF